MRRLFDAAGGAWLIGHQYSGKDAQSDDPVADVPGARDTFSNEADWGHHVLRVDRALRGSGCPMTSPRAAQGRPRPGRPDSARVLRVIALQYNPDTLTRTLQVQASGTEGGDRSQALRLKGAAVETIKLEAEIDATDRLEDPDATRDTVEPRHPPAARRAGDARCTRRPTHLQRNDALAGSGVARGAAARGAAHALRLEQAAGRAGAGHRPVDHRGGVRRRRSTRSGPRSASACGSCRSTTSASTTAAAPCSWATCGTKEGLAGRRRARAPSAALGIERRRRRCADPLQALLDAGAVPTTPLPADEPLRRHRRRRTATRATVRTRRSPYLRRRLVPAPGPLRAALRGPRGRRATAATTWSPPPPRRRRAVVAARRRQRRDRPARADRRRPDRAADHAAARRASPGRDVRWRMPDRSRPGPAPAARRARPSPLPAPQVVIDAVQEVKVESGSGETPERVRAHLHALEPLAAADAVPAHRRVEHPDPAGRDRGDGGRRRRPC